MMFYVKKLVVENKVSKKELAKFLNLASADCVYGYLNGSNEFQIEHLKKLKVYFVEKGILQEDFDVGDFLNDVD